MLHGGERRHWLQARVWKTARGATPCTCATQRRRSRGHGQLDWKGGDRYVDSNLDDAIRALGAQGLRQRRLPAAVCDFEKRSQHHGGTPPETHLSIISVSIGFCQFHTEVRVRHAGQDRSMKRSTNIKPQLFSIRSFPVFASRQVG